MGGISGGVGFEMCDLSGIPDMFWNFFSALKEGNKKKFTQTYRESIQELDEKIEKETEDIDKEIESLKRKKKRFLSKSSDDIDIIKSGVLSSPEAIIKIVQESDDENIRNLDLLFKKILKDYPPNDEGVISIIPLGTFIRYISEYQEDKQLRTQFFGPPPKGSEDNSKKQKQAKRVLGALDNIGKEEDWFETFQAFFIDNNIPLRLDIEEEKEERMSFLDFAKELGEKYKEFTEDLPEDGAGGEDDKEISTAEAEPLTENKAAMDFLKKVAIKKGGEFLKKKAEEYISDRQTKKEYEAQPEIKVQKIKDVQQSTIAKIDKQIKKLEDKKSRNKNFKKKEDFEKKIKELDDDGVFKKLSEKLATHPIFSILTPGMNIAASAVLGLSKQDCDRIKQAVADFLMILSSLLGVPVERSKIERLSSGSGDSKNKEKGPGLLSNRILEKDFHNSMKKSRGINDAQRKAINLSEDRPDDLSEFDLDLFEIIANEEYQKYSADLKADIKSAKDTFKDFKYEIGKNNSSFDELTSKMSRIIQISDASDSNREERVKRLLLSKNFPWKNYFEDSRDMSKFIEGKIKHILDELEIDGFF